MLITQLGLPVIKLTRLLARFQPAALPQCVVAVLNRQRLKVWRLPALESVIATDELVDQHIHRPAIGNDVVQGQQQHMLLLGQLEQRNPQQRTIGQIERCERLTLSLGGNGLLSLNGRQQGQVQPLDVQLLDQRHALKAVVGFLAKHCAQGFVALYHVSKGLFQRSIIQRARQTHGTRQVISATVRIQLPQKPHAPLCIRQRLTVNLRHIRRDRKL